MSLSARDALRPLFTFWFVTAIVLVLAAGAVAAVDHPANGSLGETQTTGTDTSAGPLLESNTTFIIEIQTDGDAEWTVKETFNVSTELQREEFDELAATFETGEAAGTEFGFDSFEQAADLVDAETERNMTITEEQRTSEVEGDVGKLSLSFTWENFAQIDDDRLILDDVYEADGHIWFQGLTSSQTLIIKSPDGFGFDDANVIPEQGQLVWEGPATFTNETLQAVLIGNGGDVTPEVTPTQNETPPGGGSNGTGSSLGLVGLVLGGVGVLGAVIVLVVLVAGTERVRGLFGESTLPGIFESDESALSEETAAEAAESPGTAADIDLELLSDEERVERLLEQNGGRMKQASIVKETGWSNAKVSQLLSEMEEDGRINKLRIGRENLISFPEEDVTEIGDE